MHRENALYTLSSFYLPPQCILIIDICKPILSLTNARCCFASATLPAALQGSLASVGQFSLLARLVDVVLLLLRVVRVRRVGRLQLVRHLGRFRREVRIALGTANGQCTGRDVGRTLECNEVMPTLKIY